MKKTDLFWISIIVISLILLITLSSIFYFSLVVKSPATGHITFTDDLKKQNSQEKKDIPVVEGKIIYSNKTSLDVKDNP